MWAGREADLAFGSGLEHRRLFPGRPARVVIRACPGLSESKDLGGAVLPGDIGDFQCVAHPLARNPAVYLGDVFEDRTVQLRPSHAEDVKQHRPVGCPEDVGVVQIAARDRALASKIAAAVYRNCWDPARKLLADTPARKTFSQHANILGVLEDSIPAADQPAVMKTVLADSSLIQATYYFRFYLFRAMKKVGLGDEYIAQLQPWREMLALGLTTWAENPEPTRSDCHAWSAHPNFDLLATVAGIEPAAPGFREVAIEPHLGPLRQLKATLPHPAGDIVVSYQRKGQGLAADVTLPGKLSGWFYWNGKKTALHPGQQHIE